VVVTVIAIYNGLVRLRAQADNAWADIDVQLKRRYDLVPNLVETVKGYAGHERATLEAVVSARSRAMTAAGPAAKPEPEGARSLAIERFDAEVVVARDATIEVTETIRARFTGAWNGLYRTIPVVYRTPQGFGYRLFLQPLAVTDGAGRPLRYQAGSERHYRKFKIWIPDAQDAARTVVFRYRVANALRFFTDHDELYWNVTGDEWAGPIAGAA